MHMIETLIEKNERDIARCNRHIEQLKHSPHTQTLIGGFEKIVRDAKRSIEILKAEGR